MDTQKLTEDLRNFSPSKLEWKFALYTAGKTRDGIELEWNVCNMANIAPWIESIRATLLKKPVAEKPVAPYSPFLSDKECIAAIAATDELISEQIVSICSNIKSALICAPEFFVSGSIPKPTGYAFFAESGGESAIFLRRSNPFLSGEIRITTDNILASTDKPILKLTPAVDFVLLGGACYFFSSNIEKDFMLENRHFAVASRHIKTIAELGIISNIEALEKVVYKPKNARKFIDFDKKVLEHIVKLSIADREDFLSTYGVTIDLNGAMDTMDAEQCELIIDLLCCRSCLDPLGRLAVGSNITIRQ